MHSTTFRPQMKWARLLEKRQNKKRSMLMKRMGYSKQNVHPVDNKSYKNSHPKTTSQKQNKTPVQCETLQVPVVKIPKKTHRTPFRQIKHLAFLDQ